MGPGPGRSLSRREFDAVIRRAAELASEDRDEGSLSETELYRIAAEVGLPSEHVRTALSEVRAGGGHGTLVDRVFGPGTLRASRVVPGRPSELARTIDDFFVATQLLHPVRRAPRMLQYRPAVDWASQVARAASFTSGKYYVASAKWVEVELEELEEGRTLVSLGVDPGTRGDQVAWAAVGGGLVGVGAAVGTALLLTPAAPVVLGVAAGAAVGGGAGTVVVRLIGVEHRKKVVEVQAEIEGILDRLEQGDRLEPPPPSWRRWIRRHFHGVARDLMGRDDGSETETPDRERARGRP